MQNNNWNDIFGNIFDAYKTTGKYRDSSKMEIALRNLKNLSMISMQHIERIRYYMRSNIKNNLKL